MKGEEIVGLVVILVVGGIVYTVIQTPYAWIPVLIVGFSWVGYTSDWGQEYIARQKTKRLFIEARKVGLPPGEDFVRSVYKTLPGPISEELGLALVQCCMDIYDADIPHEITQFTIKSHSIEGGKHRDLLIETASKARNLDTGREAIIESFTVLLHRTHSHSSSFFTCKLSETSDVEKLIEEVTAPFLYYSEWFKDLREQLRLNQELYDPKNCEIVEQLLRRTPYHPLFQQEIPIEVRNKDWFEGAWIIGPPGTGKTQLMQFLIAKRLDEVGKGDASIVVIDGHGDLKKNLTRLKRLGIWGDLDGKLILISPDLEYPPALNLFDMGRDRMGSYNKADREKFTNIVTSQLTYMLQAIMGEAGSFTPKQTILFDYIVRLLMVVEEATLETFQHILEMKSPVDLAPFQSDIAQLPIPAQDFFNNQFFGKEFVGTRGQVAWRLSSIRKSEYFEKMFSARRSKIDMFTALNDGKIIFVDTNKEYLGDEGTNIMGRYFIGSILAAARERASLDQGKRKPVYVFIDEAHDYISNDRNIATLLDQARKMNVALIMAHQRSKQIENANVLDALKTTKIKFANTNNQACLSHLAPSMNVNKEYIAKMPELSFAVSVGRQSAFTFKVPFLHMEKMEKMDADELTTFTVLNRHNYCHDAMDVVKDEASEEELTPTDGNVIPSSQALIKTNIADEIEEDYDPRG